MKNMTRLAILVLLAALLFVPLRTAQARGLAEGPIFGSNFTLKSGETLNEDVVVFGGTITIEKEATVNGAVVLFGGSATVDGEVSKDVVVMGGAVKLGGAAHIHGNLITFGAPIQREQGARVDGDVVNNPTRPVNPVENGPVVTPSTNPLFDRVVGGVWNGVGILGQSILLAALAVLIALLLPVQMRRVADGVVGQPLLSFGMGLLTLILFIVVIVALALFSVFIVTLFVTVPLMVIVSIMFAAGSILGWLALGMEVGERISQMFKSEWPMPLAAGLGVFVLNLVAQGLAAIVPCIGGLIPGLLGFAGLGAVLMTRFGTQIWQLASIPAAPAAPAAPEANS